VNSNRRSFLGKIFAGAIAAPAVTRLIANGNAPAPSPLAPWERGEKGEWITIEVCDNGKLTSHRAWRAHFVKLPGFECAEDAGGES
jgi:hypothetical protein